MENDVSINSNENYNDLTITHDIRIFLTETAKWSKFLSIVGFFMIAIFVIIALVMSVFMGSVMSSVPDTGPMGAMSGGLIGIVYIGMALLYFFPVLYLYRFATKMKKALKLNDQQFLSSSFENLKSCYKFSGILMIVVLAFYALGLLFTLILGGAALVG